MLLVFPLMAYLAFGSFHITEFETADEHYWLYSNTTNTRYWKYDNGRISQYWDALLAKDWKKTRINDKPGVTLAYVSGIGSYLHRDFLNDLTTGKIGQLSKVEQMQKINGYYRYPILIFVGLFSFALFYLIRRLTKSGWIALVAVSLMLLSPVLLGISQIVNPDSLLWLFVLSAILSFQIYLNERNGKFVFLTGFFLGLSLLTKYTSVILFPFLFLMILSHLFHRREEFVGKGLDKNVFRMFGAYVLVLIGGLLLYAVVLPNNLLYPKNFLKGSIGFTGMPEVFIAIGVIAFILIHDAFFWKSKVTEFVFRKLAFLRKFLLPLASALLLVAFVGVLINVAGNDLFGFHSVQFDEKSKTVFKKFDTLQILFMQSMPLVFSLTPLVLFFSMFSFVRNIFKKSRFSETYLVLSLFVIAFYLASMEQGLLLTVRYSIVLYPVMILMAAIGMYEFFSIATRRSRFKAGIFILAVALSIPSLWLMKPFYFSYMNSFLPTRYLITDSWGYGGYEAAQYLNSLPGAENMKIWSDYNGTCLFFVGDCVANPLTMSNIQKKAQVLPKFDYFVSNRRGAILSRKIWDDLKEKYGSNEIWGFVIGGRADNFIKIYKNNP